MREGDVRASSGGGGGGGGEQNFLGRKYIYPAGLYAGKPKTLNSTLLSLCIITCTHTHTLRDSSLWIS